MLKRSEFFVVLVDVELRCGWECEMGRWQKSQDDVSVTRTVGWGTDGGAPSQRLLVNVAPRWGRVSRGNGRELGEGGEGADMYQSEGARRAEIPRCKHEDAGRGA